MASKNETVETDKSSAKQSTKTSPRTTLTSPSTSRNPEGDIHNTDANKNNNNACQQATKGKKRETGKKTDDKAFKSRAMLENELAEKSQRVDFLEVQLKGLQENLRAEQTQNKSNKELYEETKAELTKAQEEPRDFADLRKENSTLSEENCTLRESIVKKDEEIERLNKAKKAERGAECARKTPCECETPMLKILRKESLELHYEKEQLKIERDRLRHTLKEKQDQFDKMSSSIGDLEDQLMQAKQALEARVKTSSRLEERLMKMDVELKRYRERKLEKQNKRLSELAKNDKANRSESQENKNTPENEKEIKNQKHVVLLQNKEEKLLHDRHELEKQVNNLTSKIRELEGQQSKCTSQSRSTKERSSQTDLVSGLGTTATTLKRQPGACSNDSRQTSDESSVRKCKGIVKSLGKFFEQLVQNPNDPKSGGTRGRRTAVAARRATELLHELSVSMEQLIAPKDCRGEGTGRVSDYAKREPGCSGDGRKSGANKERTLWDKERTLWDKVSHEVAHHEFAFEQMAPMGERQDTEAKSDKEKEVQRAEKGLHRLYQSASPAGKMVAGEKLTKDEASKLMEANRKQTEMMVREILSKHHGEIKNLVQNACQLSAIPATSFDLSDATAERADSGNSEVSLAVQELDTFKTRAAKVQAMILKMHALAENTKNDKESVHSQLRVLEDELAHKEALLQAKSQELRRRHCKTLEIEKSLHAQIESLIEERTRVGNENARLQDVCRQKDLQIAERSSEVNGLHAEIAKREKAHQQNLGKMRTRVEEAWGQYNSVKTRANKRSAEFNEAAEKLKVSQGYLLDLWQTLKTVDNVVEEEDEL